MKQDNHDMIDGTWYRHGVDEKCIREFSGEIWNKKTSWKAQE